MSSQWLEQYLSALEVRDRHEKSNADVYEAYTKLADHAAALAARQSTSPESQKDPEADKTVRTQSPRTSTTPAPRVPPPIVGNASSATPPPTQGAGSELSSLRADLSTAQRSKANLAAQLAALTAEHAALQTTHSGAAAALAAAMKDKAALERRLKDRDSELREKRALLEQMQDEVVGLEMQVNVAEEGKRQLKEENEALVLRLVGEREVEVERVNRESGWD